MQESAEACGECYSELQGESSSFLWIVGYLGPLQSCAPARGNPMDVRLGENGSMADLPSILPCNHIMGCSACAVSVLALTPSMSPALSLIAADVPHLP